ncbi:hypothetical protein D3C87_2193800 [compost metagenome]
MARLVLSSDIPSAAQIEISQADCEASAKAVVLNQGRKAQARFLSQLSVRLG